MAAALPTSRNLEINGLKLHYLDWGGDGPPLVMLHGLTGHAHTWDHTAAALSARYHVYALDQRGHGDTEWAPRYGIPTMLGDLLGFLDALQLPVVTLMGLSMGACLALRIAELQPAAIRGLVLVNPSVTADTKLFLLAPALKYVLRSLPGIASDIKKPGAQEIGYDRVPVRAAATLPGLWGITTRQLGQVTQPVLVYRSAVDHVVGPASMRVLLAGLPKDQVTVRELADSYHVATLDNDAEAIFEGSAKFIQDHAG